MSTGPPEPGRTMLTDLPALLQAVDADTTGDLQDWLELHAEWDVDVELDGDTVLVIYMRGSGVGLPFPFSVTDLLDELAELDARSSFPAALQMLEEQIETVEGFKVGIDFWPDQWIAVEQPDPYPYQRAAAGSTTAAGWRKTRFWKNYPDYEVVVLRPGGDRVAGQTRLRTLRELWREAPAPPRRSRPELLDWEELIPKLQLFLDPLRANGWSAGPFGDASDQDGPDDGPEYPPGEHHAVETLVRRDNHVALVEFRRRDFDGWEWLIVWAWVDPDDPSHQGLIDVVDDPSHENPEIASSYDEAVEIFRRLHMIV